MRGPPLGPSDPDEGVGLAGSSAENSVVVGLNMFSKSEFVTDSTNEGKNIVVAVVDTIVDYRLFGRFPMAIYPRMRNEIDCDF